MLLQVSLKQSEASLTQSLVVSLGPGVHKVLFEPSEHFWQVWSLMLNTISPLLLSCWGFSFALGCWVSFVGILHSSVFDCSVVSCNFRVLTRDDEHVFLLHHPV